MQKQKPRLVPFQAPSRNVKKQFIYLDKCSINLLIPTSFNQNYDYNSYLPTPEEVIQFLKYYLLSQEKFKEHDCISDDKYLLNIPILDQHKYIRIQLDNKHKKDKDKPIKIYKIDCNTKIEHCNIIYSDYITISPNNLLSSVDIYHALVLLRLTSSRQLPLLNSFHVKDNIKEDDIKNVLLPYTKVDINSVAKRGVVVAGPPGTGKTARMKSLLERKDDNIFISRRHSKMEPYDVPCGARIIWYGVAANFNSKHVGESEEKIRNIADIARKNPHLLCIMLVDEAEVILGDRNSCNEDFKKDRLTVILSVFKGIEDTPNLLLWASTNIVGSLDDAIYRRFAVTFRGRMDEKERLKLIHITESSEYNYYMLDLTINFTYDQITRWKWFTSNPNFKSIQTACKEFLDNQCCKESGLEFNRELVKEQWNSDINYNISNNCDLLYLTPDKDDYNQFCFHGLTDDNTNIPFRYFQKDSLTIPHLCYHIHSYCSSREPIIDHITLINNDTIISTRKQSSQNTNDEILISHLIEEIYDEYKHYKSSCIILDLDALIGISKEISESSGNTKNEIVDDKMTQNIEKLYNKHEKQHLSSSNISNIGHRVANIVTGTNTSASKQSAKLTNKQALVSNIAQLQQTMGIGQNQNTKSSVFRPTRPLVLNLIVNLLQRRFINKTECLIFVLIIRNKNLAEIFDSY